MSSSFGLPRNPGVLRLLRGIWYLGERWSSRAGGSGRFGTTEADWYLSIWRAAARAIGGELTPLGRGYAEIRLGRVATRVYRQQTELDDAVALELAGDKPFVLGLLAAAGIRVPRHCTFTLDEWETAEAFRRSLTGPGVVKPALGTGGGRGVTTGVASARGLLAAALRASAYCSELLMEEQIEGSGYRLLFLDGELLDAVRRDPPSVVGDGEGTIRELVEKENERRLGQTSVPLGPLSIDRECRNTLRRARLTLASIPARGERVVVKRATNQGGDAESESVVEHIGPELRSAGALAASVVGARLAGVDVITTDPGASLESSGGVVHEVNTTPGLRFHYMARNHERRIPVAIPILERALASGRGRLQ